MNFPVLTLERILGAGYLMNSLEGLELTSWQVKSGTQPLPAVISMEIKSQRIQASQGRLREGSEEVPAPGVTQVGDTGQGEVAKTHTRPWRSWDLILIFQTAGGGEFWASPGCPQRQHPITH